MVHQLMLRRNTDQVSACRETLLKRAAQSVVGTAVVRRSCVVAVLACTTGACGSDDRGVTQPTPPNAAPASVVSLVHNTLNAPDTRSPLDVANSWMGDYFPGFTSLRPWAWDDFTSATAVTVRTVAWQGGYCTSKSPLLPPSAGPPRSTATRFQVWFVRDVNGRPESFNYMSEIILASADAHERFMFDSVRSDADCAYYDYTAVLPTPFPVTAGTRYWFMIRADIGSGPAPWGWRVGQKDNSVSAVGALNGGIATVSRDLAFALSVD